MKKFINATNSTKEKAIKVGKNVPKDAVNLSWFNSSEVSPLNTVNVVDQSYVIPENKISDSSFGSAEVAYADELGILRRSSGSYVFPTNEITVSDVPLSTAIQTRSVQMSDVNPSDYVHYKYVSRFFISAPNSFTLRTKSDFIPSDSIVGLNIKVLDRNGFDYIDSSLNRKKYRILLEPYRTDDNVNRPEIPHRIVVLLDSTEPDALRLVYDKVESDDFGNIFNMELGYSEPVNAVSFFQNFPEESFIIGSALDNEKSYSIKKLDDKYSQLVNNTYSENGYQVFVPNKAFADYRTYEIFNWRFIARNNVSVDTDIVNFGNEYGSSERNLKTIKVGVLYSQTQKTNASIKPYIFQRLSLSPFNLLNYSFVNPNSEVQDNSYADYWKVNIDDPEIDLSQYEILAWCPNSVINSDQAQRLNAFVRSSKTLILDLSNAPFNCAERLEGNILLSTNTQVGNEIRLDQNPVLEKNKCGGWELLNGTESYAQSYYGVWGSNNKSNNFNVQYKDYRYFQSESFGFISAIVSDVSDAKPIARLIPVINSGDSLSRGNILVTTFNLMDYCNSIYDTSTNQSVLFSNFGETSLDSGGRNYYSGVVEGPMKLLFNTCAYSLYCLAQSKRVIDERSAVFNFVSDWKSSWVMNQDALLNDERDKYFVNISSDTTTNTYARDITLGSESFLAFYKEELAKFLSRTRASLASSYLNNVEIFIEITNPDVVLTNTKKIEEQELIDVGIPSSYTLYEVLDNFKKVYARTDKGSPQLRVFNTFGNYVITEKPISVSDTALLRDNLNVLNSFTSYPFNLSCSYTYAIPGPEKSSEFVPKINISFSGKYRIKKSVPNYTEGTAPEYGNTDGEKNAEDITSAIDDHNLNRVASTSSPTNIFPYTGDIDEGNTASAWSSGKYGDYATYVQFTLWTYNNYHGGNRNYYPYNLDTHYGPLTAAGVKKFQQAEGERYIDGIVDSETKWYFAKFWKKVKRERKDIWDASTKTSVPSEVTAKVLAYINAAVNTVEAFEIESQKSYRKMTFSGTVGPGVGEDVIFFKIPSFTTQIKSIEIRGETGDWGNFEITAAGLKKGFSNNIFQYTQMSNYLTKNSNTYTIDFPDFNNGMYDYGYIFVRGNRLNPSKYGQAEGFGINRIRVYAKIEQVVTNPGTDPTADGTFKVDYVDATFNFEIDDFNLDPAKWGIVRPGEVVSYSVQANSESWNDLIKNKNLKLKSFTYNNKTYNLNYAYSQYYNVSKTVSIGGERDGTLQFTISSYPMQISSSSYGLSSVSNLNGELIWEDGSAETNPVSYTVSSGSIRFSTSSVYFADGIYNENTIGLSSGYFLRTPEENSVIYSDERKDVNINDGVLLLCDASGNKVGFPNQSDILSTIDSEDVDLRFGSFVLYNDTESRDGFIFGFYDLNEKEFLGNRIEYVDYVNKNVFIGVAAIDADGNSLNDNEYIGSSGNNTFRPVQIPLKYIAPIYSVVMHQPAAIKINQIPAYLSRFDTWELPVTNGAFRKSVLIDGEFSSNNWMDSYRGQVLEAVYSTTDLKQNSRSKIYGSGYHDIYDESPFLLDERNIRVRRNPILSWNHPSSYETSVFDVIKPVIEIYIRQSINSEWARVPYSDIRNIDCQRGIVQFNSRIVPSDSDLIKVSYTTKMNYNFIKEVNGNSVPLNPVLDYDLISFNKPLYVYLNPKTLYKYALTTGLGKSLVKVEEYQGDPVVSFTYDSSIFNKSSSLYNPLALPLGTIYVMDKPQNTPPSILDTRTRGGGVVETKDLNKLINELPGVLYNWDIYSADSEAYTKGGYVIIRIPEEVKNNFVDQNEIYRIIKDNLTAGIVFEIQDMQGNTWS